MNKHFRKRILAIAALLFIFAAPLLPARAGGAGGGSGGSSRSGGGGGGAVIFIFRLLINTIGPGPTAIVFIGGGAVYIVLKNKQNRVNRSTLRNFPVKRSLEKTKGYNQFIKLNTDFSVDDFLKKVSIAFSGIQKGWSKKDLSEVRHFISDGVYQRFNTQFIMMNLLKQTNVLSDVKILNMHIDSFEQDGEFDIIHVAISASLNDRFVCELNHSLDSGGLEEFTEYWSFIRKRGNNYKDIYHSRNCPACSAPLPDEMGESGNCPYCSVHINNGEYDWVLSEITQPDDYSSDRALSRAKDIDNKLHKLFNQYPDFSIQNMEDKASNGYLQILTAIVKKDPRIMRRFVSDSAFDKIQKRMQGDSYIFNRLYLNDVSLIAARTDEHENTVVFAITKSYQRASLTDRESARLVDSVIRTDVDILMMTRAVSSTESKGNIYTHTCSTCGAPVQDSLDIHCQYCNTALNSPSGDWIISDLQTMNEYQTYYKENKSTLSTSINPDFIENLYSVKDYAFNNVIMMLGVDGDFADEERVFATDLAKNWGYKNEQLEHLVNLALAGRLSLRMPEDMQKRVKIYELMVKAAQADNKITTEESQLLEFIARNYLS